MLVVASIVYSALIAGYIISAVVGWGAGAIAKDILDLSEVVVLACDKYQIQFLTYDIQDITYTHSGYYGYKYIITDEAHDDYIGKTYYDGITDYSLRNGDGVSLATLAYNTYNCDGIVDLRRIDSFQLSKYE